MSRAGYNEDGDGWAVIRWRGAVKSAIRGKRGQAFLKETLAAFDALPEPRLISGELITSEGYEPPPPFVGPTRRWEVYPDRAHAYRAGEVCALGAVGLHRGMDLAAIDPEDYESIGDVFGVAGALARELEYENDDGGSWRESPEERFKRVRAWVVKQIAE